MSTMTWNKTSCKIFNESERKTSMVEKIKNYIVENGAIIVCGLMMANGNANVYQVYKMLNA